MRLGPAVAWFGVARRGSAWLDARRGARYRLSRGLELLEQHSAGATRHVSTIEHGRNEAITRARIHIYPVARKRDDSVRARASKRKRERKARRKRKTARDGDGKRKRDWYRKREKARDWRQAGKKTKHGVLTPPPDNFEQFVLPGSAESLANAAG